MSIPIEQLLNIPGIEVLSVNYDKKKIECQIESTRGYSICHKCGQKATLFHEHAKELELRHLPICGRQVILRLRPKRYRCPYCDGGVTTTERPDWYDAKAGCTKAYGCGSYRTTAKPRKIRLFCKFAGFIQVIFPEI